MAGIEKISDYLGMVKILSCSILLSKSKINKIGFFIFFLIFSCNNFKAEKGFFYINADNVNLRKEPSRKSKVLKLLEKNIKVYPLSNTTYEIYLPIVDNYGYTNEYLKGRWIEIVTTDGKNRGWIFSPYVSYKFTNITNGFIFQTGFNKTNEKRALLFNIGKISKRVISDVITNNPESLKKLFKNNKTNLIYLYCSSGYVQTNYLINSEVRTGNNFFEPWPGNETIEIESDLIFQPSQDDFCGISFLGDFKIRKLDIKFHKISNENNEKLSIISNNIYYLKNYIEKNATNISCVTNEIYFTTVSINKKKKFIFSTIVFKYYEYDPSTSYFDPEKTIERFMNIFSVNAIDSKKTLKNIYSTYKNYQGESSEIELFYMITDINDDEIPEIWTKVYGYEWSYYKIYIFYKDMLIPIAKIGETGV
ncbi:MAG: hypothetical protein ACP5QT_00710 [Brevinematia bacterium]